MLCDPKVEIECNRCEHFDSLDMTPLAGGAFDMRSAKSQATSRGWIWVSDSEHYCSQECHDHA